MNYKRKKRRKRKTRRKRGKGNCGSKKTNQPKKKYVEMAYEQLKKNEAWLQLSLVEQAQQARILAFELQAQKKGGRRKIHCQKTRRKRRRSKTRRKRKKRNRRTRKKKAGCWPFCLKKPQVLEDDPSRPLLQDEKQQEGSWAEGLPGHKPDDLYMDREGNILNNETGEKTDNGWNQSERFILPLKDKRDNKYYKRLRKYGQG